ncbi:ferredoxin [Xylanibacillus composti]|uniref:2Fe-2S ferredoxin-type domain-containing protein n=1 Tax=Xylanibacillus composti TaxID=1572762 RepID=A0A8J4H6Y7_9BACL|nr:2Fe-2S iron-sulfur cluster-binding protein [Xylanibacillus composti]MDT9725448.1 ferredoxin [Xylanibacillus composti]GIQ71036.1 hypothetical protein XYCOK13_38600 [Xylanibacillus composti]
MPNVRFTPADKVVSVRAGTSVLEAARKARVNIATRCGGNASCLMCKVHVKSGGVTSPDEKELRKMGDLHRTGTRLACQAKVMNADVTIELPESPLKLAVRKLLAEQQEREGEDE